MAKIGRNAPCTCGSGRKYKRCCLRQHESPDCALPPGTAYEVSFGADGWTATPLSALRSEFPRGDNSVDLHASFTAPAPARPVSAEHALAAFERIGRFLAGGGLERVPGAKTWRQLVGGATGVRGVDLTLGMALVDWLVFDASHLDGAPVAAELAAEAHAEGEPEVAACLHAMADAPTWIFEVLEVEDDRLRLQPQSMLGPEVAPITVYDAGLRVTLEPGLNLLARVLPYGDGRYTLSHGALPFPGSFMGATSRLGLPHLVASWKQMMTTDPTPLAACA